LAAVLLSGLLQGGYPLGYLLAAVAARLIFAGVGLARPCFWAGFGARYHHHAGGPISLQSREHGNNIKLRVFRGILRVVWDHRKSFCLFGADAHIDDLSVARYAGIYIRIF